MGYIDEFRVLGVGVWGIQQFCRVAQTQFYDCYAAIHCCCYYYYYYDDDYDYHDDDGCDG